MLRRAKDSDVALLLTYGLNPTLVDCSFIYESEGSVVGAVSLQKLPFETEHLFVKSVKIVLPPVWNHSYSGLVDLLRACVSHLKKNGYRFGSCRVSESNILQCLALQDVGFFNVECLLTLERKLDSHKVGDSNNVELANFELAASCGSAAYRTFSCDRFHFDPRIPDKFADALKAAWVRNACLGRADAVFVVRDDDEILAFNVCLKNSEVATIDLIGVVPEARGRGLGRLLLNAAIGHYSQIAKLITVGTQSRNGVSLGLYQSLGFKISHSAWTFHIHLP